MSLTRNRKMDNFLSENFLPNPMWTSLITEVTGGNDSKFHVCPEDRNSYYIDLPGEDPSKIKVSTSGSSTLVVKSGLNEYRNKFPIPISDIGEVKASYKWGRLTLSFPRRVNDFGKEKEIPVSVL